MTLYMLGYHSNNRDMPLALAFFYICPFQYNSTVKITPARRGDFYFFLWGTRLLCYTTSVISPSVAKDFSEGILCRFGHENCKLNHKSPWSTSSSPGKLCICNACFRVLLCKPSNGAPVMGADHSTADVLGTQCLMVTWMGLLFGDSVTFTAVRLRHSSIRNCLYNSLNNGCWVFIGVLLTGSLGPTFTQFLLLYQ